MTPGVYFRSTRVLVLVGSARPGMYAIGSGIRRWEPKRNLCCLMRVDSDVLRPGREYSPRLSAHVVLSSPEANKLEMAIAVRSREIRMVAIGGLHRDGGIIHGLALRIEHRSRECSGSYLGSSRCGDAQGCDQQQEEYGWQHFLHVLHGWHLATKF